MARWGNFERVRTTKANWRKPIYWNLKARTMQNAWQHFITHNHGLTEAQLLEKGFTRSERPRIFCGSMCDVFDNQVPQQWRDDLFQMINDTPRLDWLLLTKRIGNARKYLHSEFDNVWLGVTVCNQKDADRDIDKLINTPARRRFLSIEPMLEHIDLSSCIERLDWVIVGGETGPKARPMHPDWVRAVQQLCQWVDVPFFFKQWGEWQELSCPLKGRQLIDLEESTLCHVGTKKAGHMLDGVEYSQFPCEVKQ